MLTIAKCRDLDYYEREVIDGREDYLSESGTSPGRWVGSLAEVVPDSVELEWWSSASILP